MRYRVDINFRKDGEPIKRSVCGKAPGHTLFNARRIRTKLYSGQKTTFTYFVMEGAEGYAEWVKTTRKKFERHSHDQ